VVLVVRVVPVVLVVLVVRVVRVVLVVRDTGGGARRVLGGPRPGWGTR